VTCSSCGLALPPEARFCARCGAQLPAALPGPAAAIAAVAAAMPLAPVWLLALLWVGAGALLWVAALYAALASGVLSPGSLDPSVDPASVRPVAGLVAAGAAVLCLAHAGAAVGLMTGRAWARTFATLVCVLWSLTCIGLPLGLLGITALWRPRTGRRPGAEAPTSRPSP
jgi:hypothetical protein